MKKLLLAIVATSFAAPVTANVDWLNEVSSRAEMTRDLLTMNATIEQMRKEEEMQKQQRLEQAKRRVFAFASRNIPNFFEDKRDASIPMIKTYSINRE
jgi:hypothetical protein